MQEVLRFVTRSKDALPLVLYHERQKFMVAGEVVEAYGTLQQQRWAMLTLLSKWPELNLDTCFTAPPLARAPETLLRQVDYVQFVKTCLDRERLPTGERRVSDLL